MTALAHEAYPSPAVDDDAQAASALDEVVWQAWKAMELPEGYRAEIIGASIEVSPTGRRRHTVLINRLRRALEARLAGSEYAVYQDANVLHRHKVWVPDLFVAPLDLEEIADEEGLGVEAAGVPMVVEVTSPGWTNLERDRLRKRVAYAAAGIPFFLLVDDFDGDGSVRVLTQPDPETGRYADEHRVPYGTDVLLPSGPAEDFVLESALFKDA
ncbi:Uma2 family endonuclease [Streptomyces sp. JJ36]|uniref:Uma2 family endonuclease n=1 Tax=Streptomyces sp. JJ36 TaxID=2736645 RepID=UPI001F3C3A13|nr:Uma2 family endonuclease [Streptomyces sp. JJ36]MCF6522245.1 Uma2 family endonuclease [Streptomyces sp. JJ36]